MYVKSKADNDKQIRQRFVSGTCYTRLVGNTTAVYRPDCDRILLRSFYFICGLSKLDPRSYSFKIEFHPGLEVIDFRGYRG